MQFKSWVNLERGRAMAVSRLIGVPQSFVSKMSSGEKAIPAEHCRAIERMSGGLVTCKEMRPFDWHKYWPELADAPVNTAQAATETVAKQAA